MTMLHDKLIMLQFPSIHLLRSSPHCSKLFTQSSQLCTKYSTCHNKPLFTGYLNSNPTTDRSKEMNEIAKGVVHLQCESSAEGGVCHVYLVGTCHVSQKSFEEVKAVINYLKPQIVFLELCKDRVNIVTRNKVKVPTTRDIINALKNRKFNPLDILSIRRQAKVACQLEVCPGSEFRVAYEEAKKNGAYVYFGDRPFHITSQREWNEITVWNMMKFRYHIICKSDIWKRFKDEIAKLINPKDMDPRDFQKYLLQKQLKAWEDRDVHADDPKMQVMREAFPSPWEIRVVEHDKYMSQQLWDLAKEYTSIVAVVGREHLLGIKKYWMQPIELKSLLEVPPRKEYLSIAKVHASIRAITDLVAGIFYQPKK